MKCYGDFMEAYNLWLDECYGDIEICGYTYSASLALYRIDPIAYNEGFNDYINSLLEDGQVTEEELIEAGVL